MVKITISPGVTNIIIGILLIIIGIILIIVAATRKGLLLKMLAVIMPLAGVVLMFYGAAKLTGRSVSKLLENAAYPPLRGNYDLAGTIEGYTPDPVFVGDKVTFTCIISNDGKDKVPKGSYMLKFYVNEDCVWYDGLTDAIRPGSGFTCGSNFTADKPGEYTYKLEIIPRHGLVDANTANNVITGTLLVRESVKDFKNP
ncbi:MAG: hypothetical protein JW749_08205 [Sedimentisphaerales bacterium]|nr:hypothetical protein [Sedimentisphaerales bacterium]